MVEVYGDIHTCGGHGGREFTACRVNDGIVVQKLDVWKNSSAVNGIKVTFTDGTSEGFGSHRPGEDPGDHNSITFQPGEKVTKFVLWGNGIGTRCGRIQITTNKPQTFDWGKDTSGQTAYPSPVHSGILIGIIGRHGWQIDAFGGIFHCDIESVTLCDVVFPTFNNRAREGLVPEVVQSQTYHWSGMPHNWHFQGSRLFTNSSSFTNSTAHNFGVSVAVKAEVPLVSSVGGTTQWNMTTLNSNTTTDSTTFTMGWNASGQISGAADAVVCEAVCYKGTLNIPYTSRVVVKLTNGESYWYRIQGGTFTNISHSHVDTWIRKLHETEDDAP